MNKKGHILVNVGKFRDVRPEQHVNLQNFWEAKIPHKNSKKLLHADNALNESLKRASNKVKE